MNVQHHFVTLYICRQPLLLDVQLAGQPLHQAHLNASRCVHKSPPFSLNNYLMNLLKVNTSTSNWLAALQACIANGGTLAKPETAAENTEIQTLLGEEIDRVS